jgi:uncharacterized membrane protein YbhN (UPF0104 family)
VIASLRRAASSPAGKVAGSLLGLVVIALLLKRLRDLWHEHPVPLDQASRPLLLLALVVSFLAMTTYAMVWGPALRASGAEPVPGMIAMYYAGGLGKYLPGGAWQYVGRAGLLVRRGVLVGPASGSLVLEAFASAAAAALLAPVAAGSSGLIAAAVALVVVIVLARVGALGRLIRRVPGFGGMELHRLPGLVARYFAVWLVFGLAFWLTARALFDVPANEILRYAGVFAAAWVAGFVVVIAPGGLGVREAVIVALLQGSLGEAEAIVLATASRIAFTLVDLGAGIPSLLALRRSGPGLEGAPEGGAHR